MLNLKIKEDEKELKDKLSDLLSLILAIREQTEKEEQDEAIEMEEVVKKYEKIFDFRTLETMVFKNGYTLERTNGSHHIYKNEEEGKIIVIPKYSSIEKGFSFKIPKYINKLND